MQGRGLSFVWKAVRGFVAANSFFCLLYLVPPFGLPRPLHASQGASCSSVAPTVELFDVTARTPDFLLLDVRPPTEFEQLRIPGSVNLPPYSIKTKIIWKKKRVLLVGGGFDAAELRSFCGSLSRAGFESAAMLEGGLARWVSAGGPVEGMPGLAERLRYVPSRLARRNLAGDDVLLVDVSGGGETERGRLFPGIRAVSARPEEDLLVRVRKATDGLAGGYIRVLVVGRDGTEYGRIGGLRRLEGSGRAGLFFLEGGLLAYDAYLAGEAALAARDDEQRSTSTCGVCR